MIYPSGEGPCLHSVNLTNLAPYISVVVTIELGTPVIAVSYCRKYALCCLHQVQHRKPFLYTAAGHDKEKRLQILHRIES